MWNYLNTFRNPQNKKPCLEKPKRKKTESVPDCPSLKGNSGGRIWRRKEVVGGSEEGKLQLGCNI